MAFGSPIQPHQIDDMVAATLPDLGRFKFTDISFTLREHIVMSQLMKKNRVSFDDGHELQFNVKVRNGNQARQTGLYDSDNVHIDNVLKTAKVPWTFADTHFAYETREPGFNGGKSKILDILKIRRSEAMQSAVELMEEKFWQAPDASSTLDPFGLRYWLVANAAEGFNGGAPSGFSDVAGLSPTEYPTWRNWTAQYAAVSKTDLIRKARKASHFTNFKPPVAYPSYESGSEYQYYVPYSILSELEDYLQSENDNLGMDVGKYDGQVVFKRTPVNHAAMLDSDTTDPWIGINWGVFGLAFLRGQYMKTSKPVQGSSHNTRAVWIDWTYQYQCRDRRRLFIISK